MTTPRDPPQPLPGAPSAGADAVPPFAGWCRDCFKPIKKKQKRCCACGSGRLAGGAGLASLAIAHVDCDAFYAAVEKRDRPDLANHPVIIGGGRRGVVATCCYLARSFGVRSAMPMFKARRACPDAIIIKPDMAKYVAVSRQIRSMMEALTPLVEPLSIDEAFLDLSGSERLHGGPPALTLLKLQHAIERDVGVTVSVGLAANKFLAKLASEQDKPRGFFAIAPHEALSVLAPLPLSVLPGVGPAFVKALEAYGLRRVADVRGRDEAALAARFGEAGLRLARLARGEDARPVRPGGARKGVSAETTFETDITALTDLEAKLWRCCERVSARAKAAGLAGRGVTLKLKTAGFHSRTRARQLAAPTQLAHRLFEAAQPLLMKEADGAAFRLIGIGLTSLVEAGADTDAQDLFDDAGAKRDRVERAMDAARAKFGPEALITGRVLPKRP